MPSRAVSSLAKPSLACPAKPYLAKSRRAPPCLPCRDEHSLAIGNTARLLGARQIATNAVGLSFINPGINGNKQSVDGQFAEGKPQLTFAKESDRPISEHYASEGA